MKRTRSGEQPDGEDIEELRHKLWERVLEDDVASEEEYDDPAYLTKKPNWIKNPEDRYRYMARQTGRARLPGQDHDDMDRMNQLIKITLQADKVYNFFKVRGMSDEQIAKQFDKYFSGLEKRVNKYYFERIKNAKAVFRGTTISELDKIIDGSWRDENMKKDSRKWADVSTNIHIAARHARSVRDEKTGVCVILEIDMDSIRDKLKSPGYTAKTIFDQPKNDINEPDSLMRGMFNEEHHIPPDIDLRKSKMTIKILGDPAVTRKLKKEYEDEFKKYESIYTNWAIVIV